MLAAMTLFSALLESPIDDVAIDDIAAFWPRYLAIVARAPRTFDRAVLSGLVADRLAWAFAGGYRSALARLVPDLREDAMAALAVTEAGGNTPKAIATRLDHDGTRLVLHGDKTWTTLGPRATELLVAARVDAPGSARPELRVVRVSATAPGVTITPMNEMPFVPELPHASVSLRGVVVDEASVLLGDGYDHYVKPFRTVEDIHVIGAALGHVVRELRRRQTNDVDRASARAVIERALAAIAALSSLADAPALSAPTHVALAGAITIGKEAVLAFDALLANATDPAAERFRRDRTLLGVAGSARAKRLENAWAVLGS
jgi:alkylation response protein AidB-like acyl-CoA dehydrogenase